MTSKKILSHSILSLSVMAACVLVSATPAFAYEEDTHFGITYVMLRSVGFTPDEALLVAAVDQGMDDSTAVNAHNGGDVPLPQVEEQWRWHALDKSGEMHAAGIIARRDQLFEEALAETNPRLSLVRLGIFFHYQQDTWAHRHHEASNHLSRDAFTTYNTPTGHARHGSKPDRPPLDPVAALMSLEDGMVYAIDYLRRGLKRQPNRFLADYLPDGGTVESGWNDNRNSKYFKQINLSDAAPDSARLYLRSLIRAQIDAYTSSLDNNPYYLRSRTPDLVDFNLSRSGLQDICNQFEPFVGSIEIPTLEDKLALGFTRLTTARILSLGGN